MKFWVYLLLLICNAICHGQQAKIKTAPKDLPLSADDSIYIDDSRLLRLLQDKLEKAIEAKELTDAKLLREQLKRTHTTISLGTNAGTSPLMSPRQIYRERLGSVLIMGHLFKCDKCDKWHLNTAGAVVLTKEGIAATNHHVIKNEKAAGFGAMTRNGDFYPVLEVLAANGEDDVALVRLKGEKFTAAPLGDVQPGDPIAVISHPDKHFYSLTTGIASRFCYDPETGPDGLSSKFLPTTRGARPGHPCSAPRAPWWDWCPEPDRSTTTSKRAPTAIFRW